MKILKSTLAVFAILLIAGQVNAGSDIGGGTLNEFGVEYPTQSSEDSYYCDYSYDTLDIAMSTALNQARTDFGRARNTIRRGIQSAIVGFNKWGKNYKPLTKDALVRALELDRIFNDSCGEKVEFCQADRRALRFVYGYLQHVKERIVPLDRDYYMPLNSYQRPYTSVDGSQYDDGRTYAGGNLYGGGGLWEIFASKYKDTAIALLQVYAGQGPDYQLPEAFGNDTYELRAAVKIFNYASYDLRRDDLNRVFKCEISGLSSLAQMLSAQLNGNGPFYSKREACLEARGFADRVITTSDAYHCRMNRRN